MLARRMKFDVVYAWVPSLERVEDALYDRTAINQEMDLRPLIIGNKLKKRNRYGDNLGHPLSVTILPLIIV